MNAAELREQLAIITAEAPELRKAGVRALKLGDVEISLTPHDVAVSFSQDGESDPSDPLDDPATFGRSAGVPRLRRHEEASES